MGDNYTEDSRKLFVRTSTEFCRKREATMSATQPAPVTTTGMSFTSPILSTPSTILPNAKGEPYKIETRIIAGPHGEVKSNTWLQGDEQRAIGDGLTGMFPHSHPWTEFQSEILSGGYLEWLWKLNPETGELERTERMLVAGQKNICPGDVYHLVMAVLPGTVTMMRCGPRKPPVVVDGKPVAGEWGYWDLEKGVHVTAIGRANPQFLQDLNRLNPWRKLLGDAGAEARAALMAEVGITQ